MPALVVLLGIILAQIDPTTTYDRAYDLVGRWSCQTGPGGSSSMTYVRESDGAITMRNTFGNDSGASGEFDETYVFVTPAQYWSWISTLRGRPDFKEAATAGMWTAQKWFFDGTVTQRPHAHDTETHRIRMIYTWISRSSFEREFETYESGVWKTTSSSVCRRLSTAQ